MPRRARKKSSVNIYHVMMRGINRQKIFDSAADYKAFLNAMRMCKEKSNYYMYAYCLMPNHVHMLLKTVDEPLELVIKRIGSKYAGWYNRKNQRTGHLFQDRYRSEPVENDAYFLTVFRYILQNPMKAGMVEKPGSYNWSSYSSYMGVTDQLTDTRAIEELFQSKEAMVDFLNTKNEDKALEIEDAERGLTDYKAKETMIKITGCESATEFLCIEREKQKKYIKEMYDNKVSLCQLTRLTGMPKSTVYRMIKK